MSVENIDPNAKNTSSHSADNKGIKAVLDQALQSYERLPMLEIIFERLVRSLTSALRNLTSETVEIDIKGFHSLRFGPYWNDVKSPNSIVVFKAVEWGNVGLMVLDQSFVFSFVDLLLGGKKNEDRNHPTDSDRIITYIEQAIVRQVADIILSELGATFEPISPSTFIFDRIEHNPTFAAIARQGDAIILLELAITIVGHSGKVDLVIPYSTIEPIKAMLQQVFIGDKFGTDSVWEENFANRMYNIDVPVEAVIYSKPTSLFNVASLKIGNTIVMDHKESDDVTVRCENVKLFRGQLGKIENKIAVSVNQIIAEE